MSCVYVLQSQKDKKLYTGSTRNTAAERLTKHNRGSIRSTKSRRPFELIYSETFSSYTEARQKELFFKSGVGRRTLKKILSNLGQVPESVKGDRL